MRHRARPRMTRRAGLLAILTSCVSLGSAAAYTYFIAAGNGAASVRASATQAVTVSATTGSPAAPLLPGGSSDVTLTLTNPNAFSVTLVKVTGSGTIAASNGCRPTGIRFVDQRSLSVTIAARSTTRIALPGAAVMTSASPHSCQGATFSIPVTVTVRK